MTVISLPYSPVGGDVRSISGLLSNFDAITAALNGGLEAENLKDNTLTEAKLSSSVLQLLGINSSTVTRRAIVTASNEFTTSSLTPVSCGLLLSAINVPTLGLVILGGEVEIKTTTGAAVFRLYDNSVDTGIEQGTNPGASYVWSKTPFSGGSEQRAGFTYNSSSGNRTLEMKVEKETSGSLTIRNRRFWAISWSSS
jgi:hypothetical protein